MPRFRMNPIWVALAGCATLVAALMPPVVEAAGPTVSPSGAGTVVIGPQAMEGNLQIHPGDPLRAGFDLTMPGSHPTATATIYNASVSLLVTCSNGATPALAIDLPAQTMTDPAGSPGWYPSGDQSSPLVYQGTLTAPDLCGGGVMNDAAGAKFTATFFSTDTIDKVNFRFHYSDNTSGGWSGTVQGIPTPFAKTVTTATLTPALSLALSTDHATAIPGDTISYTATVTNTGSTLAVGGDFVASATGSGTATVVSYWDDIATSPDGATWTPLAGTAAAQSGYTPAVAPPITTGMTLSPASVAATGVTYPSSGDRILGTTIGAGDTATWHYAAIVALTPAQAAALADPTKTRKVRNSFHLEVSPANPNVTQPAIVNVDFSNLFFGAGPSASVSNIKITIQPPQNSSALVFNSTNTPALATLAPGASAPVTGTFQVPVPAAKGTQSDSSYFTSLSAVEGTVLTASATAGGTAPTGLITAAPPPTVSTTEHLPIVSIAKSGPAQLNPGDTETNPLTLLNNGGGTAASLTVVDAVTGGGSGTVSGVPPSLAAGASSSASATYPVPTSQPSGSLTDTASVSWTDANGNAYGPLSSSFTTQVLNILSGATLTLAPASAGPNAPGTNQLLTATLLDGKGNPIANQLVHFTVTGVNPGSGIATTDVNGNASFTYTGVNAGTDFVQATVTGPGVTINSNQSNVTWLRQLQPVSTTVVQGNFYTNNANNSNSCTFDINATNAPPPAFGQTFPNIMFNPDPAIFKFPPPFIRPDSNGVVFNISTRPFTDITTDVNGNPNGQIVAQGNGFQAGLGSLINFYAVFNGTFVVNQPGDLTFRILHDDGYIFGVGGSATRVSGDRTNDPATTPFNNYGVIAAWNTSSTGSSSSGPATVHFPAAGIYPYELDYTECGAGSLFLDLLTEQFVPQTNPLSVYVGYADGLRAGGSIFPFPWNGSPNTTFEGCTGCTYDGGAIRIDNSGTTPAQIDNITVDIPMAPGVTYCPTSTHFDIWPHNLTIPAGQTLILGPMANGSSCGPPETFDTSDTSFYCGPDTGIIPLVNLTSGGVTTTFKDSTQVLNTGGKDVGVCTGNESESWQRIGGGGTAVNLPVPPAATLNLTPFNVPGATQGQSITLTVAALDGTGNPAVSLPVTLQVSGANTQSQTKPTDTGGLVTFTYTGAAAGADSVEASAFVQGLRSISNVGSVVWIPPGGTNNPLGPSITSPTPADGAVITKPTPVDATIAPPSNHSITSWQVFYQAAAGGPVVVIGSGSGTPPSPLGVTFDPTLLADGTYSLTVEATADNGAVQDVVSGLSVYGALKLGRYTTTVQDLSAAVSGYQMEVRRTYDSTDRSNGDFGTGWRVEVSNFRVSSNRNLGASGWTQYNKSCTLGLCFTAFRNYAPRTVTVVFPDQHSEVFDFTPDGGTNIFWSCTPKFTARASLGTTSTLIPLDDTSCSYQGDGNIYGSSGTYNPNRFQLTTKAGQVLVLDRTIGLVSTTDPDGNRLTVDATGIHASSGQSITFTRDSAGRITDITGPVPNQHLHYSYFASSGPNELQFVTDPNGNVFSYAYTSSGLMTSEAGPDGKPVVTVNYDASGRAISLAYGNQPALSVANSVGAQQQTVIDPNAGLTTVYTYDDLGDVVERDQVFGGTTRKTTYGYDSVGHQTLLIDNLQRSWHWSYDASGNLTSYTDGAQRTWQFQGYNALGEVGSVLGPDGGLLITQTYDSAGHALTKQMAGQSPTSYTYWPNGAVKSVTDPGGRSVSFVYDAAGHLTSRSDSAGTAMTFTADAAGQVTATQDPTGHISSSVYDGLGNVTQVTDANHHSWIYFRDSYERLQRIQDPLGHSVNYFYDDRGRIQRIVDRNGASTTFVYDVDGRMIAESRPNNDNVFFTYDALGQMTGAADSAAHDDFTYDGVGNLASQTSCGPTGTPTTPCAPGAAEPMVTLSYGYNNANQPTSIGGPDGITTYVYDARGRLSQITDPSHHNFGFSYDIRDQLTGLTRPNGVNDTFTLDASGDLLSRTSTLGSSQVVGAQYVPDSVTGRTKQITDLDGAHSYAYLADGQLQSATHPAASGLAAESYAYDPAGNRTSWPGSPASSVSYDSADRLLSDGVNTYTYDAEGDLIAKAPKTNSAAQTTYDWNTDHQLLAIHYPDATSSTFAYDALGRRVQATGPGFTTRYTWDINGNVHNEYDGSNQLVASYVQSLIADKPLEVTEGGASYYYLADGTGNIRALTDQSGAVVDSYRYDSFGNQAASGTVHNPFTYAAREFDSASGLYYNRARYYDPATGRFISEDPLSRPAPYVYASNNPISLHDPSGTVNDYIVITTIDQASAGPVIVEEQLAITYTVGVAAPLVVGEASVTAEGLLIQAILYGPLLFRLVALVVAFGYEAKQFCDFLNSYPSTPSANTTCPSTQTAVVSAPNEPRCGPLELPDPGGDGTKPVVGPGK